MKILPVQNSYVNQKENVYQTNFRNKISYAKEPVNMVKNSAGKNFSTYFEKIKTFFVPSLKRDKKLSAEWKEITENLNIDMKFEEIASVYKDKSRKYHNLNHIYNIINNIEDYEKHNLINKDNSVLLKLSAFMHDFYQDENGVTKSAEKASTMFYTIYDMKNLLVKYMIRATDHTRPLRTGVTDLEKILKDADLAILGSSKKEYKKYTKQIQEENSNIPKEIFIKNRIVFLEKIANNEKIYQTNFFYKKYENFARKNINEEIKLLKQKL